MYVTALLFFNVVSQQFHTHFLYLSTSFLIPSEKQGLGCSRIHVCTTSCTSSSLPNWRRSNASLWTKGMTDARCEVDNVRWLWLNVELEVSNCLYCCSNKMEGKHCRGAREQFLTAVANCRFQFDRCLASQQLQTHLSDGLLK